MPCAFCLPSIQCIWPFQPAHYGPMQCPCDAHAMPKAHPAPTPSTPLVLQVCGPGVSAAQRHRQLAGHSLQLGRRPQAAGHHPGACSVSCFARAAWFPDVQWSEPKRSAPFHPAAQAILVQRTLTSLHPLPAPAVQRPGGADAQQLHRLPQVPGRPRAAQRAVCGRHQPAGDKSPLYAGFKTWISIATGPWRWCAISGGRQATNFAAAAGSLRFRHSACRRLPLTQAQVRALQEGLDIVVGTPGGAELSRCPVACLPWACKQAERWVSAGCAPSRRTA